MKCCPRKMVKSMSEHRLQNAILDKLVDAGCLAIRVNSGMRGVIRFVYWMISGGKKLSKGVSDIIGVKPPQGLFFAVECKDAGEKPTPEQTEFLQAVKNRGGMAIVAYSILDVDCLGD